VFILLGQASEVLKPPFKPFGKPVPVRRGYLYALRVMDHFRGLGIGTRLLIEAERLLIERNNFWATISVAKANARARQLYQRLGYSIYAEDAGRWQYVNHLGEIVQVNEPCWMLEKFLEVV
jgi:ribosomal protein S18 acetylase RimI-like enzyme